MGKIQEMNNEIIRELKERIGHLEEGLKQSKNANKRIKEECRYIDYKRLLGRFYRQKEENEERLEAMIKIWDLTNDLPNCKAKDEIIRTAGSIIYKDN